MFINGIDFFESYGMLIVQFFSVPLCRPHADSWPVPGRRLHLHMAEL